MIKYQQKQYKILILIQNDFQHTLYLFIYFYSIQQDLTQLTLLQFNPQYINQYIMQEQSNTLPIVNQSLESFKSTIHTLTNQLFTQFQNTLNSLTIMHTKAIEEKQFVIQKQTQTISNMKISFDELTQSYQQLIRNANMSNSKDNTSSIIQNTQVENISSVFQSEKLQIERNEINLNIQVLNKSQDQIDDNDVFEDDSESIFVPLKKVQSQKSHSLTKSPNSYQQSLQYNQRPTKISSTQKIGFQKEKVPRQRMQKEKSIKKSLPKTNHLNQKLQRQKIQKQKLIKKLVSTKINHEKEKDSRERMIDENQNKQSFKKMQLNSLQFKSFGSLSSSSSKRQNKKYPLQCSHDHTLTWVRITPNITTLQYVQYEYDQPFEFSQYDIQLLDDFDLDQIHSVVLSTKEVKSDVLESFTQLNWKNLRSLRIDQNRITDIKSLTNLNLKKFQDLDISLNPLGIQTAQFLSQFFFEELIYFTVSFDTGIDSQCWEIMLKNNMENYPKLQSIDICNSNQLTASIKQKIKQCFREKSIIQRKNNSRKYPQNYEIKITWSESKQITDTYTKKQALQISLNWAKSVNLQRYTMQRISRSEYKIIKNRYYLQMNKKHLSEQKTKKINKKKKNVHKGQDKYEKEKSTYVDNHI